MNITKKLESKLDEYGFDIFEHYDIEKDKHVYLVNDMILFVNKETNDLSVAFHATTRPDIVANNILIIKEIDELNNIHITESFIFTNDKGMIKGEEAFEIVKKTIMDSAIDEYVKHSSYVSILNNSKCFEC